MSINVAIVGIGGFARAHHTAIRELEREGRVRLVATCDPRLPELGDEIAKLELTQRGVALAANFDELLATHGEGLGLVTIPVPIHLHAPMHAACVGRGHACYLEKPPTLDPEEFARMVKTDPPDKPAAVGFQHLANPQVRELKRRIVAGEFGRLNEVSFLGLWARGRGYYGRNGWAGRLLMNDNLLLDSCVGNAMSHHVMNLLYYAGSAGEFSWSRPSRVTSQLYRANPIQGADTVLAEFELEGGVRGRIATSHAAGLENDTVETLVFEKARIEIRPGKQIKVMISNGQDSDTEFPGATTRQSISHYLDYLEGKQARPAVTIADCAGFVDLNALLYLSTNGIGTMPGVEIASADGGVFIKVPGLDQICRQFVEEGKWPESTGVAWAVAAGQATPATLSGLRARVDSLAKG